jgi:hypothetical protein
MPPVTFVLNKPVDTPTPNIEAIVANAKPGEVHTFSLVVIDDAGNESAPVTANVEIRQVPVAKIVAPPAVGAGKPFALNGAESQPQAHIKTYRWTLVK